MLFSLVYFLVGRVRGAFIQIMPLTWDSFVLP